MRTASAPWRISIALTLSLALPLAALAQSASASLTGVVRDPGGKPVAEAVVQARLAETGAVRTAITGSDGRYRFEGLRPGVWLVVARLPEGPMSPAQELTLSLQSVQKTDFVLGPAMTEEVTVRAERPMVDPSRTGGELRVDREQVNTLPLAGRDATNLALLDSAVRSPDPGNFFGERGSVFVINGQSGRSNSFLVDGLDNNDITSGTTLNSFFSQQVIREFVVLTNQFAPEFGRASGGILNIITEQGTNDVTFEAFAQGSDTSFSDASDFVENLPDPGDDSAKTRKSFQTGFKLGGPIKDDKAFYFMAYEHQEIDDVVPFTGLTRDGALGGRTVAPRTDDNFFVRTDFNIGNSNFLMARLSVDDRTTEDLNVGGVYTPEAGFTVEEQDVQLAASLTTVMGPNLLNEVRFLAGNSRFDQFANSDRPGVERPSGVFGGNNLNLQEREEDRIQVVENITWQKSNHTMKFGLNVNRSSTTIKTDFNPNGNFIYDTDIPFEPGDCGNLLISDVADHFLNGGGPLDPIDCPGVIGVDDDGDGIIDEPGLIGTYPVVYTLIDQNPEATMDDTQIAFFAQDSWQATPKLLLDYGLRYDVSTYELPSTAVVASSIPNGGASRDEDNIAPRFGFSYMPRAGGKLVIRGGAGVFYDKLVLAFPGVANITSGTQIGMSFPQGLTFEITEDLIEEIGVDPIKNSLFFPEELTLRFSTGTDMETPYSVQYNLGAERAVGSRAAWRINITRVLGYHQVLLKDLNPVIGTTNLGIPIHPDPTTGSIAAFVTEGRTWYTGLDLGWQWRGDDLAYSASYTWSKAEDMGPDPLKGGIALPPDSFNIAGEKARSDADRQHRLVLYGETGLPWAGLRVSSVIQASTGAPFNVTTGRDDNLDGIKTDRPDGVGRNSGEDTSLDSINALRADQGLPAVDGLDEPDFFQLDLRVWRPFLFRNGKAKGEFFVQVFNATDESNPGPIEGRAISANFGQPVGELSPPRTLEIGLKVGF